MRIIWYKDAPGASIVSVIGCVMVVAALAFIRTGEDSARTVGAILCVLGLILVIAARCMAGSGNKPTAEQKSKARIIKNQILKAEEARKAGDTQGEITALEELIKTSGASISNAILLGSAYTRANDYDNAIAVYKKVIVADKNCAEAYAGITSAYIGLGDYDKALYYASKSAALTSQTSSDYPDVMANYALVAGKCGDLQTAEDALQKAEIAGYKNSDTIRNAISL